MQLILVGGFLGSGKTTCIAQAASALVRDGRRVAVVTNDQGMELVDTGFFRHRKLPVREVTGGCFCCNYPDFLQNLYALNETISPEFVFAESVGSCTDLVATIARPMAEMHPEFNLAISVFVDAGLLHSIISGTSSFIDEDIRYLFRKQMEEADFLVLNKSDLLPPESLSAVLEVLRTDFPSKKILEQNSLDQRDIRRWLEAVSGTGVTNRVSLDLDYERYGSAEAKLAWLDAVLTVQTARLPAVRVCEQLARGFRVKIRDGGLVTGHLKFLVDEGKTWQKISYTTIDHEPPRLIEGTATAATVIVNARVQADPDRVKELLLETISGTAAHMNCTIDICYLSAFRPGFPNPTHRIA